MFEALELGVSKLADEVHYKFVMVANNAAQLLEN
jgi:hypothetical protein